MSDQSAIKVICDSLEKKIKISSHHTNKVEHEDFAEVRGTDVNSIISQFEVIAIKKIKI